MYLWWKIQDTVNKTIARTMKTLCFPQTLIPVRELKLLKIHSDDPSLKLSAEFQMFLLGEQLLQAGWGRFGCGFYRSTPLQPRSKHTALERFTGINDGPFDSQILFCIKRLIVHIGSCSLGWSLKPDWILHPITEHWCWRSCSSTNNIPTKSNLRERITSKSEN